MQRSMHFIPGPYWDPGTLINFFCYTWGLGCLGPLLQRFQRSIRLGGWAVMAACEKCSHGWNGSGPWASRREVASWLQRPSLWQTRFFCDRISTFEFRGSSGNSSSSSSFFSLHHHRHCIGITTIIIIVIIGITTIIIIIIILITEAGGNRLHLHLPWEI